MNEMSADGQGSDTNTGEILNLRRRGEPSRIEAGAVSEWVFCWASREVF